MKIFKVIILGLVALISSTMLTSCLKAGLDELPAFDGADITNIGFEYRFEDPTDTWIDGSSKVKFVTLGLIKEIKIAGENGNVSDSVIVSLSVPAPNGSFNREERQKISLTSLVGYVYLSTAAKIEPVDDAPLLGVPGDYTKIRKYKVTAADGKTSKIWNIRVNPLPVINQYEGLYIESGTLLRAGNPADELDAEIYLETIDANTCRAQAGKSVFNNPGILYQIQVNTDNTVTIKSDPNSVVAIYPQEGKPSTYDPSTKTFDLHYAYNNGARVFDTKLVLK